MKSGRRKGTGFDKGVTLIELIIVLSVGFILLQGCLLSLSSLDRRRLQQASVELQGDLRYAQRRAIMEGVRYKVAFDRTSDSYDVIRMEKGTNRGETIKAVTLPDGITIYRVNISYVEYNPRGTDNRAFTVVLKKGAYMAEMTGNVGAGRVSIKSISKTEDDGA